MQKLPSCRIQDGTGLALSLFISHLLLFKFLFWLQVRL